MSKTGFHMNVHHIKSMNMDVVFMCKGTWLNGEGIPISSDCQVMFNTGALRDFWEYEQDREDGSAGSEQFDLAEFYDDYGATWSRYVNCLDLAELYEEQDFDLDEWSDTTLGAKSFDINSTMATLANGRDEDFAPTVTQMFQLRNLQSALMAEYLKRYERENEPEVSAE